MLSEFLGIYWLFIYWTMGVPPGSIENQHSMKRIINIYIVIVVILFSNVLLFVRKITKNIDF